MALNHRQPMGLAMERPSERDVSPLRQRAADMLRRARKLPVGHEQNNLRQLAMGLLWLDKRKLRATAQGRINAMLKRMDLLK
jgi:hypothetical protein